ncbi:hypothetical protein ECE50_018235 [Chitinophaga sp. Mgbs1]|uniref:Uncharacterized protein n=1 Tax=Chitinophaga solisilvae TaxID=1233460 RepID=A0A3S1DMX5_9BACT|nr:hypothetical protein [Chitinophaga solisilvae]
MKKHFQVIAALMLILSACGKNTDTPVNPDPQSNADKVLAFIHSMGYTAGSIVDNGDAYIVAGDVRFPKNMQVPDSKANTEQRWTGSKISVANALNVRIKIDPSISVMSAEINGAVNLWNTAGAPGLHISVVTGAAYDILIKDTNLGTGICGQGTFPSGGAAGALIQINKSFITGNSFAQRQRTIAHEIGHNISLMHTNEAGGLLIPGSQPDLISLMNGGQCNSGATTLSPKDKNAVKWLYP